MLQCLRAFRYGAAILVVLAVQSLAVAAPPDPPKWRLEARSADRIGVAGGGSLWTWVRADGRVKAFEPDGTEVLDLQIGSGASAVAVDPSWGAAFLDDLGVHLEVRRPDGSALPPVKLPHAASSVTWIDEDVVALAPDRAAHRVEIWDVENARPIRHLGQETAIGDAPGAAFLRRVELAYDPGRARLFTLESRTGEFSLFELEGNELGSGQVTNPRLEEFDAWLAEIDRRARDQGEVQRPALSWFHLAVDPDGTAWTVEECVDGKARLLPLKADGTLGEAIGLVTSCCSLAVVPWQGGWLFHRGPSNPRGSCTDTVPR